MIALQFCPFTFRLLRSRFGDLRHYAWGWLHVSVYPLNIFSLVEDAAAFGVNRHLAAQAWSERPVSTLH